MTRDEIIALAKQAGFLADGFGIGIWDSQDFNDFANLVAEKEREACAEIAVAFDFERPLSNYGRVIANAIRARGQK